MRVDMAKSIFIVEDEQILSRHLGDFFRRNGFDAVSIPHGEECLDRLRSGERPELILMDLNLGKNRMGGAATPREIYRLYDIPVVLHSAYTDKETLDETRGITKYGYVQKVPGNEQFVLATVEMAIELHRSERRYRKLSNHLQNVREEQNAYLAREIHDDLGQALTALKMNLSVICRSAEAQGTEGEKIVRTAGEMEKILNSTVKKVRKISTELRPSVLDAGDIVEALEWEIEECNEYFDVETELVCEEEEIRLDRKKSLAVFRIVQESMTNSVRHGGAGKIRVHLQHDGRMLSIRVEDDGKGFEPEEEYSSFGLLGMRERALQCGGNFRIESSLGDGTVVHASIPLGDEAPNRIE